MNSLSWLLYASEVVDKAGGLSLFIAIAGFVAMSAWTIGSIIANDLNNQWPELGVKAKWAFVPLVAAIISVLLPSQKTAYMIAASEMGERVAQTEDAREVYDLLRKKVREVLK